MKKIILSAGMLVAVATASFAQNNTTTIDQLNGDRNTVTSTQTGQNLRATINQNNSQASDNTATVTQTGRASQAVIVERGKFNEVLINQSNSASAGTSGHVANVNINDNASQNNSVDVLQTGKQAEADVDLEGDGNTITLIQGGDKNQADVLMNSANTNDDNSVSITQMGQRNQASIQEIEGDRNTVTIDQAGSDNEIGIFDGGGNDAVTSTPGAPVGAVTVATMAETVTVPQGVNIEGDDNTVSITQGENTRDNEASVQFDGGNANDNMATIVQSDNARNNTAVIEVLDSGNDNMATINQTGTAQQNGAGISQEGDFDMAVINQGGLNNNAVIRQLATTVIGANMATINQPAGATNNNAYIEQDGIRGSTATITQVQDGGTVFVFQTDQGGHNATITQDSDISGARLVLQQNGRNNTANLNQTDINFTATDVEIIQNGQNNTVNGLTNPGNQRVTQNGNGNTASY